MTHSTTFTEQYERKVDRWVRDAVAQGYTSLDQIIRALPGVYPSLVCDALRRIAMPQPTAVRLDAIQETFWPSLTSEAPHPITLPVPHPLDYDWRFSDAAVAYLLNASSTLVAPGATIALLGAPSIMRAVIENPRPYQFLLLDANPAIIARLVQTAPAANIVRCDLARDPLPDSTAALVIADPPWYEEHMRLFLWAASQLCQIGGSILMSVPPVGTRPGISQEWERTLRWAEQLGIAFIRLEAHTLEYLTPPFEYNALHAEGLDVALPTWRRGNLAIFTRRHERQVARPPVPPHDGLWDEVQVAGIRVRLRRRTVKGFADPSLVPLVPGHVLPTVSRRDPRRQHADVWTSGNRIFACRATPLLAAILRAIASHHSPIQAVGAQIERTLTAPEQSLVMRATRQAVRLLTDELHDTHGFWEGTLHDEPVHLAAHRAPRVRSR